MTVVELIIVLAAIGFVLWLVNNYMPIDAKIKKIINIVVVAVVILFVLSEFGLLDSFRNIRIRR